MFLSLIISFISLQKLQRMATFAVAVFVELGGVISLSEAVVYEGPILHVVAS